MRLFKCHRFVLMNPLIVQFCKSAKKISTFEVLIYPIDSIYPHHTFKSSGNKMRRQEIQSPAPQYAQWIDLKLSHFLPCS